MGNVSAFNALNDSTSLSRSLPSFATAFHHANVVQPFDAAAAYVGEIVSGRPVKDYEFTRYTGTPSIQNLSRVTGIYSDPLPIATNIAVDRKLATSLIVDGEAQYGLSAKRIGSVISAEEAIAETIRNSANRASRELNDGYKAAQIRLLGEVVDKKGPRVYHAPQPPVLYNPNAKEGIFTLPQCQPC